MVEVTVPPGHQGGDTLTFNLPSPASRPAIALARPVTGAPPPPRLPPPSDVAAPAAADGSRDAAAVRVHDYPQAVAMPPTEPSHTTYIVDTGARPYYSYRGYCHPYYYYDPYEPFLFSTLFLTPLLFSPLFFWPLWC